MTGTDIAAGPKFAELHVHLEGTLEPEMIFDLARRKGLRLPYEDLAELRARYEFTDLQSFLDLYYANLSVLTTEDDFFFLAEAYLNRAAAGGVAHVDLFVDPQAHMVRGIAAATVLRGVDRAITSVAPTLGMSASIIVCVLRDHPVLQAHRMLEQVLDSGVHVAGIGLDSAEVGYPPSLFSSVFETARQAGLHTVAHAGEEGPASYVWEALDLLGVERVDHGNRALEDDALVRRLVADQIPLTLCPLSNRRLKVVESIEQVPLRRMLDAGLRVTVNSDDPAYFGGYLDDNVRAVTDAFSLTADEIVHLASTSIDASFATPERKLHLLTRND